MKKNGFLTFVFACIPGAGQMYYGYMKRGLSMITIFCLGVVVAAIIAPMVIVCPIVWMYSFFDTYDLIRRMTQGDPKPDTVFLLESRNPLSRLLPSGSRLLGWALVALGCWAIYSSVLEPLIIQFMGWYVANLIPTLVVAGLLIAGGCWLISGPSSDAGSDGMPSFPNSAFNLDDNLPDLSGMMDETLGTGPAPQWPKAGVRRQNPANSASPANPGTTDPAAPVTDTADTLPGDGTDPDNTAC